MTRAKHSIDGFVPRRPGGQLAGGQDSEAKPGASGLHEPVNSRRPAPIGMPAADGLGLGSAEISESLQGIDTIDAPDKKAKKRQKKPKSKLRRIMKWVLIALVLVGLGVGGWLAYKALHTGTQIFKGNILDIVQNTPLKQDGNGRSNIVILGTSEDDPHHDAPWLTDSIMVLSVDQKNKNAYMVSIPRDLEVQYGQACMTGYKGKINVYYNCVGGGNGNVDADRAALTKEAGFVGGMLGMDIQYGVNVNYTVMRELVSTLGGITVTIESRDPHGQMDSNFDWKCGVGDRKVSRAEVLRRCPPRGHFIDYPNGPVNLDAEHALYLAQARGDSAPTYGFEQSNFDREKNQQKIVKAIREKATSAGTLSDIGKVMGIIDALGNNLRTTFETKEIRTLVDLAKDIKSDDIQPISLIDGEPPLLNGNAQPTAGLYQFGAIQAFLKKKLSSDPVIREEAKVVVLNGSGVTGVGQREADALEVMGFTISGIDTAPEGKYADVEVYQIGNGKPGTKAKLEPLFKVKAKTTKPPVAVAAETSFVVIFGKDRSASQ